MKRQLAAVILLGGIMALAASGCPARKPDPDVLPPAVSIASPTAATRWTGAVSRIDLAGTASDNVGVASVSWTNEATGASGPADGLTAWSVTGISLDPGPNRLVVRARDAAGNLTEAALVAVREYNQDELLAQADAKYLARDWEGALALYTAVSSAATGRAEAWIGLGWCLARQGSLEPALGRLRAGLALAPDSLDCKIGLAGLYEARQLSGDLALSIRYGNEVLAADSAYSNALRGVSHAEVRLILATAYYFSNDLPNALGQVQAVDPAYAPDTAADGYREDLLDRIQTLRAQNP